MAQKNLVVIGASAGGLSAIKQVLSSLPTDFSAPILIAQHILASSDNTFIKLLSEACQLKVQYAMNGYEPEVGTVYVAPPDYHLRLDSDGMMMLSNDSKVRFSRPSIDVLFHSVSQLKQHRVIAVVLTGANADGAAGAHDILEQGGELIVQAPGSAEVDIMPRAALKLCGHEYSVWLDQIGPYLWDKLNKND